MKRRNFLKIFGTGAALAATPRLVSSEPNESEPQPTQTETPPGSTLQKLIARECDTGIDTRESEEPTFINCTSEDWEVDHHSFQPTPNPGSPTWLRIPAEIDIHQLVRMYPHIGPIIKKHLHIAGANIVLINLISKIEEKSKSRQVTIDGRRFILLCGKGNSHAIDQTKKHLQDLEGITLELGYHVLWPDNNFWPEDPQAENNPTDLNLDVDQVRFVKAPRRDWHAHGPCPSMQTGE